MIRLMIAEDEENTREAIRDTVPWKENGITVCAEAANGREAIERLLPIAPDVLLLDIRMPVVDGLSVAQYIHDKKLPIRIIILSGHDEFCYAQQALKCGAADYLLKPCSPEDILASVLCCASGSPVRKAEGKLEPPLKVGGPVGFAIRYMEEHYSENTDLSIVASHAHITPVYLSQLFKRETGAGFVDYLNQLRIRKACELLRNPEFKIYEISDLIGYRDEKYFARMFKRFTGFSPSSYRKSLQAEL